MSSTSSSRRALLPVLVPLLARLRRLFDLDANPRAITEHLGGDSVLGPLVARRPGLRVAGAADGFELALRAVLGQQVTVRGATTLAGRLARLLAEPLPGAPPALAYLPISAERLAGASLASITGIGLPRARAECVLALARAVAGGELPELASDDPPGDPEAFGRRLQGPAGSRRMDGGIRRDAGAPLARRVSRWRHRPAEGDGRPLPCATPRRGGILAAVAGVRRPAPLGQSRRPAGAATHVAMKSLMVRVRLLGAAQDDEGRRIASMLQGPGPAAEKRCRGYPVVVWPSPESTVPNRDAERTPKVQMNPRFRPDT